ncbi:MAG: hypothetical protein U1F52_08190 [Burkholderiales bacterium]
MIVKLRRGFGNWVVFGGHGVILVLALQAEDFDTVLAALALIGVISFFAWVVTFLRYRSVAGTPTSKVASAAQGYVELFGQAAPATDDRLADPASGEPCLWFRMSTWRKDHRNNWTHVGDEQSDQPIGLRDDTGLCAVSVRDAQILVDGPTKYPDGSIERRVWRIRAGDPLYAIGRFETQIGPALDLAPETAPQELAPEEAAVDRAAKSLLSDWQRSRAALLRRFDADGNGKLDEREWVQARAAARQEARLALARRASASTGRHVLRAPEDHRMFLIATRTPDEMASRLSGWVWFHLAMIFVGIGAGWWLWVG